MTPDRWQQVSQLYHAALARDANERGQFLAQACEGDDALRREVESLLAHEGAAEAFLVAPALDVAAKVMAGDAGGSLSGRQIGSYQILSALGAGGMGDVYRARDRTLNRDVALKVLPEHFALDADRLARFKREAQVLASLNHPHIAAIYGLEESHGVRALVLELVEGPTLADRIARGPIPVDETLPIARQIADALEAAHEHGIIHRDLKPANIKLRPDGTVKVLDFGLAKAFDVAPSTTDVSQSPTITSPAMTGMGVILGTAAYMSPEQARGKPVDKRADIWAFGCVLYEMLAGKRAFGGDDVTDTLARVLMKEPEWPALPPSTPPAIGKLIRRCLAKDRRERLADAADARLEINETLTAPSGDAVPTTMLLQRVPRWRDAVAPTLTLILGGLIVGLASWSLTRPVPPQVARWTVTTSGVATLNVAGIAISPDGTRLAYVDAGAQQIFVRALDQLQPTALQVRAARFLFFSPDGQWIGFSDGESALKKVAATGGPPVIVSRTQALPIGASWSTDDTIVFATLDPSSGLLRVAAAGGQPEVLTTVNRDQGELDHQWPEVLPGGRAVLFTIATSGGPDNAQIAVLDLTTREQKILIRGGSHARYVPTGHLVYGLAGTLRAVAFDLRRLEVVGTPVPVLDQVMTTLAVPRAEPVMSISDGGTLVYVPGGVQGEPRRTLVWVDRQGREEPLKAPPRAYVYPRLSPDGTRVALDVRDQETDVWIWDLARETLRRLTFDPRADSDPVWTPDGQRVVFRSQRAGPQNLFWQAADGTGAVERLTESPNQQHASAFSPDGTRLVFREDTTTTGEDLMVLALEGGRRAQPPSPGVGGPGRSATSDVRPLVQTTFEELNGEFSPDGRSVAYESNESGQEQIYVRPFPDANSGRWQISTSGGRLPLWARSGKELFYLSPSGAVMRVAVEGGSTFRAGNPMRLFEGPYFVSTGIRGRTYDVSPDGQRFLMIKVGGASDQTAAPTNIVVVQNWTEDLKRLVPTR